jgi:hypothetical protein
MPPVRRILLSNPIRAAWSVVAGALAIGLGQPLVGLWLLGVLAVVRALAGRVTVAAPGRSRID